MWAEQFEDNVGDGLKVINGWCRTLTRLQKTLPTHAAVLAKLIVKNKAFAMRYPVTVTMFAKEFLSVTDALGVSPAEFEKLLNRLPSLERDMSTYGLAIRTVRQPNGAPMRSLKGLPKSVSDLMLECAMSASVVRLVHKWFRAARRDLQAALNSLDSEYVLCVESVPKLATQNEESGYIVLGTARALHYFIDRDEHWLGARTKVLQHRRDALADLSKAGVASASKRRRGKTKL